MHMEKEKRAQRVPLAEATPDVSKGKRSGNFNSPGENKVMRIEAESDKPVVSPPTASAVTPATAKELPPSLTLNGRVEMK